LQHIRRDADFWRGRKVLLTGHTGFKGSWMTLWLRSMGAEVTGYALAPIGAFNLWDIVGATSATRDGWARWWTMYVRRW
jgi:CDP-glucose 4,6-dehydratase